MDVREQAVRLRKALEAAVPPRGRRHFPEALMREVAAYYAVRAADGQGADAVGAEIGIAGNTLRRWHQLFGTTAPAARPVPPAPVAPPPRPMLAPTLVPVAVVSAAAPARAPTVIVRGPHGLQIEGLDVDALATLLRRLA